MSTAPGRSSEADWQALEAAYSCSVGTCNTMGTASTMTVLSEALGMMLPGSATIPANDTRRLASAEASGRRAVELVRENLRPAQIMTRPAFENALRVFMAIGGSTNAVIHLLAIAGRLRVPLALDDFDQVARATPLLLNLLPSGARLMADFDAAGGLPALMRQIDDLLHLDHVTVSGRPLGELLPRQRSADPAVIRPRDEPLRPAGALAVLRGNLAPRGAIIRTATASDRLLRHRGPALVFDSYADMLARIDAPDLPVTADRCWCCATPARWACRGCRSGARSRCRKSCCSRACQDIVRISDSRMSGTSFGTVVLHVTPEAAVGGALALVSRWRPDRAGCRGPRADTVCDRCGAGAPPRRLDAHARAAPPRLPAAVCRACAPARRRLRFRFPAPGVG